MIVDDDPAGDWTVPGVYRCAPGVHRIPLPLPNDGLRAVNVYALADGDGLTLVDAGWALARRVTRWPRRWPRSARVWATCAGSSSPTSTATTTRRRWRCGGSSACGWRWDAASGPVSRC